MQLLCSHLPMHVHPEAGRHFSFVLSGSFLGPAFARLQRRRRPGAPSAERTRASKDLRLKGSPVSEAGFVTFGTLSTHFTHSPKLGFVAEGGAYYNRRSLCVPADPASVGSLQPGQLSPCSPLLSAGSRRGTTRARERGKARRSRKPPFLPCAVPPLGEGGAERTKGGALWVHREEFDSIPALGFGRRKRPSGAMTKAPAPASLVFYLLPASLSFSLW